MTRSSSSPGRRAPPVASPASAEREAIETLARQFSAAADGYNARLKAEAAAGRLDSGAIYARLQEEQRLRGMANQLWFEAADARLASAAGDVPALQAAVATATESIATLQRYAAALDLVGDLLALAAAVLSRKPLTVEAALNALQHDSLE